MNDKETATNIVLSKAHQVLGSGGGKLPPRPCSSFFRLFFNITIKNFLFGKPVNIVFILGQALVLSAVYVLTPLILKQSNEVSIITPPVFR